MTADFQSALRNAEGSLAVARDNLILYERLYKQWRDEVTISTRVLDRLREAAGIPLDAPITKAMPVKPEPPVAEATHASPLTQLAVSPSGFDRAAAVRRLKAWRVGYPLKPSYKQPSQMKRQAVVAVLTEHEDYDSWRKGGGPSLTASYGTPRWKEVVDCAEYLGVDHHAIIAEALKVQRDIAAYGTPGVDFLWGTKP